MQLALSDVAICSAKPTDKLRMLSDADGLQLFVFPNGSKLRRFAYRFDGKQKTLALGAYPEVTLARARERTLEARRAISEGVDPSETRRRDRLSGALTRAQTFETVAAELIEERSNEGIAKTTRTKTEWLIAFALPDLGKRPIAEISSPEILAVLRKVEAKGRLETARRLRSVIGQVSALPLRPRAPQMIQRLL